MKIRKLNIDDKGERIVFNILKKYGRKGSQLIWRIRPVPPRAFCVQLNYLGEDNKTVNAFQGLRLPGTINAETNSANKVRTTYDYIQVFAKIQMENLRNVRINRKKTIISTTKGVL